MKLLQKLIQLTAERVPQADEQRACSHYTYRVAQKSKQLSNYRKIVLKPVNEIRFIRQIKVWIKHYNNIR